MIGKLLLVIFVTIATSAIATASVVAPGQTIPVGQTVSSANGQYVGVMQGDGNFVVYRSADQFPLWSTSTSAPGSVAHMQTDGNFVVYSPGGQALWHSRTAGKQGAYFTVSNSGQAVVLSTDAVWSSKTSDKSVNRPGAPILFGAASRIPMDGRSFYQNNGQYRLAFQTDGNFVLFKDGRPIFKTDTHNKGVNEAVISQSRIFMMRGTDGASYVSDYDGNSQSWAGLGYLAFQTDGNLVMYTPRFLWGAPDYDKPPGTGAGGDGPICVGNPQACIPPHHPIGGIIITEL